MDEEVESWKLVAVASVEVDDSDELSLHSSVLAYCQHDFMVWWQPTM
jgi:hypothetical protein